MAGGQQEREYYNFNPLSDSIDLRWAGAVNQEDKRFNSYYDYYFSGEDIKVYIDGLYEPEDELDIAGLSYSIRQEKQPVYGFWSYNYDAMLFGTRIIAGELSVFSRYPRRMTDLLEKAALNRVNSRAEDGRTGNSVLTRLDANIGSSKDEENIQKYWAYSQLDRISQDPGMEGVDPHNIFSAHPPFNLVILYGAEDVAMSPFDILTADEYPISDNLDRIINFDVNQRTVKVDNLSNPMKVVIQQINLFNMTTSYQPGGSPIVESYQFLARDFYFSDVDMSFVKNLRTNDVSSSAPPVVEQTESPTSYGWDGTEWKY